MWTISVQLDADSNDVGTITATWTEKTGTPPAVFTYSARARKDSGGVNTFVAAAIAARNFWQAKNAANFTGAAALLTKINAADPQAGG
jgi:hypothetical protein